MSSNSLKFIGPILLVDDDDEFLKVTGEILKKFEGDVYLAKSADHAIKFCQSQPWTWTPKLVLTDIVMSGMGGYEFIRRITDMYPNKVIPKIVISKLHSRVDVVEAEEAGSIAYLHKPLTEHSLINGILSALEDAKKKN